MTGPNAAFANGVCDTYTANLYIGMNPALIPAPLPFRCKCGERQYATDPFGTGAGKCPTCHTFATDHEFYGDESSDFRCYDCDARSHSHR